MDRVNLAEKLALFRDHWSRPSPERGMAVEPATEEGGFGIRLIGASKLAGAALLACAGFGIFRLLNKDLGALEHFVTRLHLDSESRLVQWASIRLSAIDRKHLEEVGAGTFFYAPLEGLEGIGLLLRRRWAEYLTVLATGLLLPLEVYEIARKPTALRIAVLVVNLAILAYLIVRLVRSRRGPGESAGASPKPNRTSPHRAHDPNPRGLDP